METEEISKKGRRLRWCLGKGFASHKKADVGYLLGQNEQFLKKAYGKALMPCILSILSGNINILADGILVGQRLGTDALAAINFSLPVYLVLCIAGSFIVSGTAICASEAIGNNKSHQAQKLYQMAIFWCVVISLAFMAAGLLFIKPLTGLLCADGKVAPFVREYIGVTLVGALPKILVYVPFWFLRLDGRNGKVTVMMVVMGAGTVLLDVLFLYVLRWGVFGAGLASVLATMVACFLGIWWLCDKKSSFSFGIGFSCKEIPLIHILQAGSPSAMNNLFQTLRVVVVNGLLLQFGGSKVVAAFTAVNCICAFAESVTVGVPQAASAMLGIYNGEHDNGSIRLLLLREIKSGLIYCVVFSVIVVAGADSIAAVYGLDYPLRFALLCLGMGMFLGLPNSILSGYYNVSGRIAWANGIIFLRVFLMTYLSLLLLLAVGGNPWWFLLLSEVFTMLAWFAAAGIYHYFHPEYSRFLLMDDSLERTGRVINFSVKGDVEEICNASSKITVFCEDNGMSSKQVMRISLAIEEIMTLITSENGEKEVEFDIRVYSLQGVIGIRFRYSGKEYNPLSYKEKKELDDVYMGLRMIEDLVEETLYQRTFGVNTLQIFL